MIVPSFVKLTEKLAFLEIDIVPPSFITSEENIPSPVIEKFPLLVKVSENVALLLTVTVPSLVK